MPKVITVLSLVTFAVRTVRKKTFRYLERILSRTFQAYIHGHLVCHMFWRPAFPTRGATPGGPPGAAGGQTHLPAPVALRATDA